MSTSPVVVVHRPEVDALADAMLDARAGASVPAGWMARRPGEQRRRTRQMAANIIAALSERGYALMLTDGAERPEPSVLDGFASALGRMGGPASESSR